MSVKKTLGIKAYNIMMGHLTRKKIPQTAIKTADEVKQPPVKEEISDREAINAFMKRNPQADGGRIKFDNGSKLKGRNKGTTKAFYDESTGHIHPRTNRFGTFYSDTPAGGIRRNIINEKSIIESLISFKRAGANAIVTYFADRILKYL